MDDIPTLHDALVPTIRVGPHILWDPSGKGVNVLKCKYCGDLGLTPGMLIAAYQACEHAKAHIKMPTAPGAASRAIRPRATMGPGRTDVGAGAWHIPDQNLKA